MENDLPLKFKILGNFEFQEVNVKYLFNESNCITMDIYCEHTEFNGADGTIENFNTFEECWQGLVLQNVNQYICLTINSIEYKENNAEYRSLEASRLIHPYNLHISSQYFNKIIIDRKNEEMKIITEIKLSKDVNDKLWMEYAKERNGSNTNYK